VDLRDKTDLGAKPFDVEVLQFRTVNLDAAANGITEIEQERSSSAFAGLREDEICRPRDSLEPLDEVDHRRLAGSRSANELISEEPRISLHHKSESS
jgi:hypothetical protein